MFKHATLKYIVVQTEKGFLKEINEACVKEIQSMSSYYGHTWGVTVGDIISPTVDCFTFGGWVQLCHEDADVIERDYKRQVI